MAYCDWGGASDITLRYHDEEWGIPLHDERGQFEFISMEVMQCGLNWNMMMKKRGIFRKCFDNFEYRKIAQYGDADIERIMNTDGMIHSRRKIEAIIGNARAFILIQNEFGSFCDYLWLYSEGKTILYDRHNKGWIPVSNGLSDKISADLKKRGFKYLGTVTVYSHLQACGIINDHDEKCPCYKKIINNYPTVHKRRYLEKDVRFYSS